MDNTLAAREQAQVWQTENSPAPAAGKEGGGGELILSNQGVQDSYHKNSEDPFKDIYGSGRESHPEEWAEIRSIERFGGEFDESDLPDMCYQSGKAGVPGRVRINKDASIFALRHENQHFLDDMADGWKGALANFKEYKRWILREERAYLLEIREADKMGLTDVAKQLWQNYLDERNYIITHYRPLPKEVK